MNECCERALRAGSRDTARVPLRAVTIALVALIAPAALADPAPSGRLLDDSSFQVHSTGDLAIDGGLYVGAPSGLPAGMSTGVGGGVTRGCGCAFAYGARVSWSTETEESQVWNVTQWDLRLRAIGMVRHRAGRGVIGLRLGAGATIVHEHRTSSQGMRGGLMGSGLESKAVDTLPAGELEAVVELHVAGPWLAVVSAGPSFELLDGSPRGGWVASLGVGWQP